MRRWASMPASQLCHLARCPASPAVLGSGSGLYAVALLGSWIFVTAGTFVAVNVWVASAGMLVVGFLVSYLAIGGPRLAGISTGLLLMFILPSFPPYTPEALDSRLDCSCSRYRPDGCC